MSIHDRGVVLEALAGRYGSEFAERFAQLAGSSGSRHPTVAMLSAAEYPPTRLRVAGYRLAGSMGGIPIWVHPSGNEIHLLGGTAGA